MEYHAFRWTGSPSEDWPSISKSLLDWPSISKSLFGPWILRFKLKTQSLFRPPELNLRFSGCWANAASRMPLYSQYSGPPGWSLQIVFGTYQVEFNNWLPLSPYLLQSLHHRVPLGHHKAEKASSCYFFALLLLCTYEIISWNVTHQESQNTWRYVSHTWRAILGWLGHVVMTNGWVEVWVVTITAWCNMWHRVRGPYVSIGRHWYSIQWNEKEVLPLFTLDESIQGLVDLFIWKPQPNSQFCLFSTWIELYFYLRIFRLES